jgi:hypothetical protein
MECDFYAAKHIKNDLLLLILQPWIWRFPKGPREINGIGRCCIKVWILYKIYIRIILNDDLGGFWWWIYIFVSWWSDVSRIAVFWRRRCGERLLVVGDCLSSSKYLSNSVSWLLYFFLFLGWRNWGID